jgi:hypothetical protein
MQLVPRYIKEGCEPCGYLLHYHGHDIDGAGADSHYDSVSHENFPDLSTTEAPEETSVDDPLAHLLALQSRSSGSSSGRYAGNNVAVAGLYKLNPFDPCIS